MVETEADEYNLMSKERKQSLRVSLIDNKEILMVVINLETQQKYSALVSLPKLKQLSKIFNYTKTPREALSILKKCIESGGIVLIEDLEDNYIELKYTIRAKDGDYPTFQINLYMEKGEEENNQKGDEDVQVLEPIFDYKGNQEAQTKYGNTSKDTTEFVKPIVQSNVKPPVLELEIIEPIVLTHCPDGTTKKTTLPPRIQGPGGQTITEEQLRSIQEQMDNNNVIKNFSPLKDFLNNNRSNSVSNKRTSIYSTQSLPSTYNYTPINPYDNAVRPANQATQVQIVNNMNTINYSNYLNNSTNGYLGNDFNRTTSDYSSMTLPNKSHVAPNFNYTAQFPNPSIQNNGFNRINIFHSQNPNQNNEIIERRPRMVNNPRDAVRSASTPHENYAASNSSQYIDVYQPNPTNNPFQTIQDEYLPSNFKKYPYDRNTQKAVMRKNNLNDKLNLTEAKVPRNQYRVNQNINKGQQIRNGLYPNNMSQIQLQQQQKQYGIQQYNALPGKRQVNQNILRQQNQNVIKNNTIETNRRIQPKINQKRSAQYPPSLKKPIKPTNSLTEYSKFIADKQTKTEMSGFKNQISTPMPSSDNFNQQLLKLAQMASMQNEENPQFKNFQAFTLEEKHQQIQSTEDEEYRPREFLQEKEYGEVANENQSYGVISRGIEQENVNSESEAVFLTETGRVIFRNGLLRGIIHRYTEIDEIVSKIQDILLKGVKFTLVYKAFDLGDKAKTFHEKCDKLKMSLVLVETDKDVRFGGFTMRNWEGNCLKKIDNNAFVFSLDNNTIYDVIKNEPAIGCYPKFGPVFFGCQIRIYDSFFTEGGTTCRRGLNYKTKKDFELNKGKQKYLVKDIEVYNIETVNA